MLKTPATRIYWKQESENSTVFSKLAACSRLSTVPTSGLAGEYLGNQWSPSSLFLQRKHDGTYQGWPRTQKNAQNWAALVMMIWPMILARTFLDTRLAVGLLGCIMG